MSVPAAQARVRSPPSSPPTLSGTTRSSFFNLYSAALKAPPASGRRSAGSRARPGRWGAPGKVEGGGPAPAPYFVAHDLIEVGAVARAAVRNRTPML